MKRWARLLVSLAVLYVLSFAALFVLRQHIVFPFVTTNEKPFGIEGLVESRLSSDPEIVVWMKPPKPGAPVLLFFGGNLGIVSPHIPKLRELTYEGYGVVALAYRGGGGRSGVSSEAQLYSDATAVYDALDQLIGEAVPTERRVAYGVSLGSGVATELAARRPVAGLILETPFERYCDVAFHHLPIYPSCLALYDARFDNAVKVGSIDAPLLILHGTEDEVVPFDMGRALYEQANQPKRFVQYDGGRHNDLRLHGAGRDILAFLSTL